MRWLPDCGALNIMHIQGPPSWADVETMRADVS